MSLIDAANRGRRLPLQGGHGLLGDKIVLFTLAGCMVAYVAGIGGAALIDRGRWRWLGFGILLAGGFLCLGLWGLGLDGEFFAFGRWWREFWQAM